MSAAAGAHFANPRNDFWRLLHETGFTPRLLDPQEQHELLGLGIGVTNAAYRTTPGSGDLRRSDFAGSAERLERVATELKPRAIAFVGKEAYRGVFGERPELGLQSRRLGETAALRPAVDIARECRSAVRRTPEMVPRPRRGPRLATPRRGRGLCPCPSTTASRR